MHMKSLSTLQDDLDYAREGIDKKDEQGNKRNARRGAVELWLLGRESRTRAGKLQIDADQADQS